MSEVSPRAWKLIAGLLALSAVLKLYHLTAPALDWQSWNQITTLANARYIYRNGLSALWLPRVDLYASLDPDSNTTFAEFPLLHLLMAVGYWIIGGEAAWVGRTWNILFSLLGGVYLARLAKCDLSTFALVAAVGIYALSPSNLYFHRTLKTDVPFMAFMVVGFYYFVAWLERGRGRDAVLAGAGIALAALFKAYALYMGASFVYLLVRRQGWRSVLRPWSLLIAAICLVPIGAWLMYGVLYLRNGFEGRNLVTDSGLLGSWGYLIWPEYYQQLITLWLGWMLTPLVGLCAAWAAALAIWSAIRRKNRPAPPASHGAWPDWLTAWWVGVLVYVIVVRGGIWEHDYYEIPVLPPLAVTAALGLERVWVRWAVGPRRWWRLTVGQWVVVVLLTLSFLVAVVEAKNKSVVEWDSYYAGRAVAAVRQPHEKTVYVEAGGLRHQQALHYTGGEGWRLPMDVTTFDGLRPFYERGGHYLLVSMQDKDWRSGRYPVPLVRELLQQGHLKPLAESTGDLDRYDRPRHWAVYRINP